MPIRKSRDSATSYISNASVRHGLPDISEAPHVSNSVEEFFIHKTLNGEPEKSITQDNIRRAYTHIRRALPAQYVQIY